MSRLEMSFYQRGQSLYFFNLRFYQRGRSFQEPKIQFYRRGRSLMFFVVFCNCWFTGAGSQCLDQKCYFTSVGSRCVFSTCGFTSAGARFKNAKFNFTGVGAHWCSLWFLVIPGLPARAFTFEIGNASSPARALVVRFATCGFTSAGARFRNENSISPA